MRYFITLFMLVSFIFNAYADVTPIKELRDNWQNNQTVTVQGWIMVPGNTLSSSRVQCFIQDNSDRGIMIYKSSGSISSLNERFTEVEVTGTSLTDISVKVMG